MFKKAITHLLEQFKAVTVIASKAKQSSAYSPMLLWIATAAKPLAMMVGRAPDRKEGRENIPAPLSVLVHVRGGCADAGFRAHELRIERVALSVGAL